MKRMCAILMSFTLIFMVTSCTNKKELTPQRVRNIIYNWFDNENKQNCRVTIVQIMKVSDYSQIVELKFENFTFLISGNPRRTGDGNVTAHFLFDKKWKMIKVEGQFQSPAGSPSWWAMSPWWDGLSVTE